MQQDFCRFGPVFSDREQPFLWIPTSGTTFPFIQANGTPVSFQNEQDFDDADNQIELIDFRFVKETATNKYENTDENSSFSSPMFDSLSKFGDINFVEKKGK